MRTIKYTNKFKKDYKREKGGQLAKKVESLLNETTDLLKVDIPLPDRYSDHQLSGNLGDCRECHIRPDLLLIYRRPDDSTLELVRLGSHSELFG
jgi:mRNA interferase YafQ